jgi:hypothetical protein
MSYKTAHTSNGYLNADHKRDACGSDGVWEQAASAFFADFTVLADMGKKVSL